MRRCVCSIVLFLTMVGCGAVPPIASVAPTAVAVYGSLHIVGNHFASATGQRVELQGVSYPHLEYDCTAANEYAATDFLAIKGWNSNAVRLPLNATFYLNEQGSCPNYRQRVREAVQNAEAAHLYVILSLFWINPLGQGKVTGAGYPMPDTRQAPAFWQAVASDYANDGHTIFEVYSEPHDVTEAVWRDGGTVQNTGTGEGRVAGSYLAIGMQALVDQIHAVAPNRIALVNTPNWGGTPGLLVADGFGIHGTNIGYTAHIYDSGPNNPHPERWGASFGTLAATVPVVAAEFGDTQKCNGSWLKLALPYLAQHTAGYFAWAWTRDPHICQQPSLILDKAGSPSPYGQPIYDFYLSHE